MDDTENRREEGDEAADLYDQEVGALGNEPAPLVDDIEDDDYSFDEDFPPDDGADTPAWVGVVTGAALGLAVVQGLVFLGTFAQGLSVERFEGDFFHKFGVAMLSNIGSANGLMLLVAAVLAGMPVLLGVTAAEVHRRRAALTFSLVALLAVLLVVGTPLAVRARVHVLDLQQQAVDSLARRVLATYVAGTLGSALVALGATLGLSRLNRTQARPAPESPGNPLTVSPPL